MLVETLTLILSLCQRERRALSERSSCKWDVLIPDRAHRVIYGGGGIDIMDALFRLAPLTGRGLR